MTVKAGCECTLHVSWCCVPQDSEGSVGLPVAVQCVSLPYQEEMVLRIMKDIDSVTRRQQF